MKASSSPSPTDTHTPISVQERRQLYQDLVLFWWILLQEEEIRAVVFHTTPHMGWDITLFYMARLLGVRTLSIHDTILDNKILLLDDFRHIPKVPDDYLANHTRDELLAHIPFWQEGSSEGSNIGYIRDANRDALLGFSQSGPIVKSIWAVDKTRQRVRSGLERFGFRGLLVETRQQVRALWEKQYRNSAAYNGLHNLTLMKIS